MPHYEPHKYPDDPYRVASPHQAPGEVEPPDAPQVSQDEAVRRVVHLLYRSMSKSAFGETGKVWVELLADDLLEMQDILVRSLLADDYTLFCQIGEAAREFVHKHANDQLAEMSPDELEREGFPA